MSPRLRKAILRSINRLFEGMGRDPSIEDLFAEYLVAPNNIPELGQRERLEENLVRVVSHNLYRKYGEDGNGVLRELGVFLLDELGVGFQEGDTPLDVVNILAGVFESEGLAGEIMIYPRENGFVCEMRDLSTYSAYCDLKNVPVIACPMFCASLAALRRLGYGLQVKSIGFEENMIRVHEEFIPRDGIPEARHLLKDT